MLDSSATFLAAAFFWSSVHAASILLCCCLICAAFSPGYLVCKAAASSMMTWSWASRATRSFSNPSCLRIRLWTLLVSLPRSWIKLFSFYHFKHHLIKLKYFILTLNTCVWRIALFSWILESASPISRLNLKWSNISKTSKYWLFLKSYFRITYLEGL